MEEGKRNILRVAGFGKEVALAEGGHCPGCSEKINNLDFRDDLSRKEFGISGLCQKCQDSVFGRG